jgi:hypothetical protein
MSLATAVKRWREENPAKVEAHRRVFVEVRASRLLKLPCQICGNPQRVHAHHDDYSKPLMVLWLCVKHHGMATRLDEAWPQCGGNGFQLRPITSTLLGSTPAPAIHKNPTRDQRLYSLSGRVN